MASIIELRVNRLLLDSTFDGYKLSLEPIVSKKKKLPKSVDRVLLNSTQYTLLHTKLFAFHNHLIGDQLDENNSIYYIDADWNICKTYIDPFNDELIDPIIVWTVPKSRDRKSGDYNVSLKFVTNKVAVVGDGTGILYIVDTGSRSDDDPFSVCFSDEVAGQDERFVIIDAIYKITENQNDELHVLLLNIKHNHLDEPFSTVLHWIFFSKLQDGNWGQIALRQLKTNGEVQYASIERSCEAIYVVSDDDCRFIVNSECPVINNSSNNIENTVKTYKWSQNIEDITIEFSLPGNLHKNSVNIKSEPTKIEIKYDGNDLLRGDLHQRIDSDLTTWNIHQNCLEVTLNKIETGLMWPELVKGDQRGEYVVNTCIVEQVHEQLAHLCSDSEAIPQSGTTFNSQQIEECDFETDKTVTFQRLCGNTNNLTHKAYLGSHQVLMTTSISPGLPPALGTRSDIDVCLWQPQRCGDNFFINHEATLLAFGYIQASKQNRKFIVCPPDMSYSVICESSRHLFLYRQKKPISSSELRNRSTGRRVHNVAQQQVVNIPGDEIIGIYSTSTLLFLLCETSIMVLKL